MCKHSVDTHKDNHINRVKWRPSSIHHPTRKHLAIPTLSIFSVLLISTFRNTLSSQAPLDLLTNLIKPALQPNFFPQLCLPPPPKKNTTRTDDSVTSGSNANRSHNVWHARWSASPMPQAAPLNLGLKLGLSTKTRNAQEDVHVLCFWLLEIHSSLLVPLPLLLLLLLLQQLI